MRGVIGGGQYVLLFEERIISQDFSVGRAGGEKLQHVGDANTLAAYARMPPALPLLDSDPC